MELTFIDAHGFVAEWNRQRLTDEDLASLEHTIAQARGSAPVIRGSGGLRKIRFAPPSRHTGKSGAMRVGFAYLTRKSAVIVVAMFSKTDAPNFTAAQRAQIGKWLNGMERSFK